MVFIASLISVCFQHLLSDTASINCSSVPACFLTIPFYAICTCREIENFLLPLLIYDIVYYICV